MGDLIARGMAAQLKPFIYRNFCEFLNQDNPFPWTPAALQAATIGAINGTAKHPGVAKYTSHASNANSGVRFNLSGSNKILLAGGEKATFIFSTGDVVDNVTRRFGFLDNTDQNAPTDGVYFKQTGDALTGQTANNTTISTTGTSYTITTNTWYRGVVELNTACTLATFTLYADDSDTVLWTDTLATNIPTGAGRVVGHGDICTLDSSTGAVIIGYLDYFDFILPNARKIY